MEASAAAKDKAIATRRQTLLGANQFPNFTEVALKEITAEAVTRPAAEGNVLTPYRGAMAFEAMRLHVDRSGKQPKAFMLTCGNLAMARARAQFSCNFFACAGIRVQDNTFFKSIEEGVKAALESKAEIVVVCASGRRLRRGRTEGEGAARRQSHSRSRRRSRMRTRTGGPGHHELHLGEVERPGDSEVLS